MNFAFLASTSSLNALFGAGLGAAFYILLKTHKYLVNGTFDSKYNNSYLTRFFTGVVAGFILATLSDFILHNKGASGDSALASITPGIIAILGGFSAEAVEEILRRMIQILLTTVRGDGKEQAEAKSKTEKAVKFTQVMDKLNDLNKHPPGSPQWDEIMKEIRNILMS